MSEICPDCGNNARPENERSALFKCVVCGWVGERPDSTPRPLDYASNCAIFTRREARNLGMPLKVEKALAHINKLTMQYRYVEDDSLLAHAHKLFGQVKEAATDDNVVTSDVPHKWVNLLNTGRERISEVID